MCQPLLVDNINFIKFTGADSAGGGGGGGGQGYVRPPPPLGSDSEHG